MLDYEPDVVVCGAGAAGMAASLSAARAGARVLLCDQRAESGGTYVHALLHTLAGLYDSRGEPLNAGLPLELEERLSRHTSHVRRRRMGKVWVLTVDPQHYQNVTHAWLREEPHIHVKGQTRLVEVMHDGAMVNALTLEHAGERVVVHPRAVIDASGSGDVARSSGAEYLLPSGEHTAGGLVLRLHGVKEEAFAFPRSLAVVKALGEAVALGRLPGPCARAFADSGLGPQDAFLKLFVPHDARHGRASAELYSSEVIASIVDVLRALDGFRDVRLAAVGQVTERDAGRVLGEYVLTASDVRTQRAFDDAACRCAWPIEHWSAERGVTLEYLPPETHYEIPMRALRARGIQNLFVAGKCLSAEPLAQASARCVGTCWAMGDAVGREAALRTKA